MQILWIKSDYIEPPDTGGKIRTYNLLRQLNQRCRLDYISLQSDRQDISDTVSEDWASQVLTFPYVEEKKSGVRFVLRVFMAAFSTMPYIVRKYLSPELRNSQRQFLAGSDGSEEPGDDTVLVCDFLEMTGNVDWNLPCPKLLFQHNVESVIWRRYFENERNLLKKAYFWFEHLRLKRYERKACNRFDMVLVVSAQDREVLQQLGVDTPIEIVETGVDTLYFEPQADQAVTPGRLLFLGSLDWMPNIDGIDWFVNEIYPRIRAARPQVSLDIVGRRPTAAVEGIAEKNESVNVYGSVPDVRPYVAAADLFVVPLRIGSGTRLKIFEAMAMQRPVVSTTVGAEGLPVEHGRHLMLADSPEQYARTVISMLENPAQKRAVAKQGHELVTNNYSWKTVSTRLHETCLHLCQQSKAKAPIK